MQSPEFYSQLFWDSLLSGLLFPLRGELTLKALYHFGEIDPLHLFVIALLAWIIAACVNWLLGRLTIKLILEGMESMRGELAGRYEKAVRFTNRWGFLFVIFLSWISTIGPAVIFVAGLFRMRMWLLIASAIASKVLYYMLFVISAW